MNTHRGIIFIIPLILSIGIIPIIPFSDAATDQNTECREGQILVERLTHGNYACISIDTAKRWQSLGIIKIIDENIQQELGKIVREEITSDAGIDYSLEQSLIPYAEGGTEPLTATPIIGIPTKEYPPTKTPGLEELAENEMRVSICGSGMPYPTISQAAACVVVELGNGDKFLFDIGTGSMSRLNGMAIDLEKLNKVFVGHLHSDHVGDMDILLAQGIMSRIVPIELYGPSGPNHELGTAAFADYILKAYDWDLQSRKGAAPTSGLTINVHEFDYSVTQVVYEENGVQITAFPAIHGIDGAVSYRLDWNDLSFVFSSDTHPNKFLVENSQNVDFLIHETFATPEVLQKKLGFSKDNAETVSLEIHTPPQGAGVIFSLTQPRLAGMYHQLIDSDVIGPTFEDLRISHSGPAVFLQDMTVVNITPDYIVIRQLEPNLNPFPIQDETVANAPLDAPEYKISEWLEDAKVDWQAILKEAQKDQ